MFEDTDFKGKEIKLRALLEEVYDAAYLITFDQLLQKYASAIGAELDLVFYLREKRWFEDRGLSGGDFLKFSYLSFEFSGGSWSRFSSREELEAAEVEAINKGMSCQKSRLCVIYYPATLESYLPRIINLTKRIFVAFYKNCGSFEHFRDSVASRYIKEFHEQFDFQSDDDLIGYINDTLGIDVAYCRQKDEMYFVDDYDLPALIEIVECSNENFTDVFENDEFKQDLKTSILKKNMTFGYCDDCNIYYFINTLSEEYFLKAIGDTRAGYKVQQKGLVIYTSEDNPLSLESVYFANKLIENVLNTREEFQRDSIFIFLSRASAALEQDLSDMPVAQQSKLKELVSGLVSEVLERATEASFADRIAVHLFDPVKGALSPLIAIEKVAGGKTRIKATKEDLSDQKYIAARVFNTGQPLDYWHSRKLELELDKTRNEERIQSIKEQLISRRVAFDAFESNESATYASPMMIGAIQLGVAEFSSPNIARMSADIPFFEHITDAIGESIRRIGLANDRGWLAKMSYVHAARHKIEAILRELRIENALLATELEELFRTQFEANLDEKGDKSRSTVFIKLREIEDKLKGIVGRRKVSALISKLNEIDATSPIPDKTINIISEIFDTIASNAQHSKIESKNLCISFVEFSQDSAYICVSYTPSQVNLQIPRADQICVSPIKDHTTPTYHYGLFLLSAQVRMIGGAAIPNPIEDDGLGSSRFGVTFLVPLRQGGKNGWSSGRSN